MNRNEILARMRMRLPLEKQIRVIISSDVANEADDQYAIVHQLLTPMFDVRGIIAAHFESKAPGTETTMEKSYQELQKLMDAIGMEDVPALHGCTAPLKSDGDAPASEGVEFLIREETQCSLCLMNDMTKLHEMGFRGTPAQVKEQLLQKGNYEKGEYAIVLELDEDYRYQKQEHVVSPEAMLVEAMMAGRDVKSAIAALLEDRNNSYSKNELKAASLHLKKMFGA